MANEVEIIVKSKDQTSAGFDSANKSAKNLGKGFDNLGEKSDNAERATLGLKDTIDGVGTIMAGPGEQGIAAYVQGWADLAGGMANFVIPALKALSLNLIKTAANAVASAGRQVAAWAVLSAQATAHAARVAAAWLIAIGPIAVVIAAIVGLVVVIVKNWDTIKRVTASAFRAVTGFVRSAIQWIRSNWPLLLAILTGPIGMAVLAIARHKEKILDFFRSIPGKVRGFFSNIANIISAPFRAAVTAVRNAWNSTIGGKGFTIPDIPGLPGRGTRVEIPKLRHGGIKGGLVEVGESGRELVRLPQGSQTIPNGSTENMLARGAGSAPIVIEFKSDGTRLGNLLMEIVRESVRIRGGNVQAVLGQ